MRKVLIANRGEIAVRIIRACHDLGLETVAVYSKADSESLHVLHADEAICIGEAPARNSYLKIPNILSVCEITGADAVHPGYGFLSENPDFASICDACKINFIGPSAEAIALLGDKSQAKQTALKAGCPVVPGSDGVVESVEEAIQLAKKIGYPLLIKASSGGGGKGIREVRQESDFAKEFLAAQTEAKACFNNGDVYLEKLILNPRHVEVQIIGDKHGNYVHLGERDCSIQRRRQKLIEEAPSPLVDAKLRKKMGAAAIALARAANYHSAGTVEFLLDEKKNFYFMEMNTRIQVEHTVSEELTGYDIVVEQLKVAMGKKLSIQQEQVFEQGNVQGHVIECRINAEDPAQNFCPSPGRVEYYLPPGGPYVRVDSACYSGCKISPYYDSMIAKLIVSGKNRAEAIFRLKRALREFHIGGIKSTIPFHLEMLNDENFIQSNYDLNYVDQMGE